MMTDQNLSDFTKSWNGCEKEPGGWVRLQTTIHSKPVRSWMDDFSSRMRLLSTILVTDQLSSCTSKLRSQTESWLVNDMKVANYGRTYPHSMLNLREDEGKFCRLEVWTTLKTKRFCRLCIIDLALSDKIRDRVLSNTISYCSNTHERAFIIHPKLKHCH